MTESRIALSVREELSNPATSGQRHSHIKNLVIPLLEIGLHEEVVFAQFRQMYDPDLSDQEIRSFIEWGKQKLSLPAAKKNGQTATPLKPRMAMGAEAVDNAKEWLTGLMCDADDLWKVSPIRPSGNSLWQQDCILLLEYRYDPTDLVCINARYKIETKQDGFQKACPLGPGQTMSARAWIDKIRKNGIPQDRAGAWIRMNPLLAVPGNGELGAHTDKTVAAWRYLLLESDELPLDIALRLYAKLKLPIAAIIDSAGRGPHAWAELNSANEAQYRQAGIGIFALLARFSIDPSNGNSSRLARLPGAQRTIGPTQESAGQQRLLYLAAEPNPEGIFP
jgi:hypothetical protein